MPVYCAIITGTGQAGLPLADRLTKAGMRVAIVERGRFGGNGVNTSCIPSKTLVASAYAARMAARAAEYGVAIDGRLGIDMKRVKARMHAVPGQSRSGVESWLRDMKNCTVLQGHARFRAPRQVQHGRAHV